MVDVWGGRWGTSWGNSWAEAEAPPATASLSGTIVGATEKEIVTGGRTIIITVANDTWVAEGATFNAQRQNIIDGLDSDGLEATGWNNEVRDELGVSAVVRTSDTVVTISLPAFADYDIREDETITVTVPSTALSGGVDLDAGSFEITAAANLDITDTDILQLPVDYVLAGQPKLILSRSEREGVSGLRGSRRVMGIGGSMGGKTSFTVTTSRRGYD